jgi:hypothetical protein
MAEWVNNGSCKDISELAMKSLAPTSQAGGNMVSSNEEAMTAPGSQPVDVLKDRDVQSDPAIEMSNDTAIRPGTDGKPKARGSKGHAPGAASWGKTTAPDVAREK